MMYDHSGVESGGCGGALAPPEFGSSEKGRILISAHRSLAITASTSGFEKLSTALDQCSVLLKFVIRQFFKQRCFPRANRNRFLQRMNGWKYMFKVSPIFDRPISSRRTIRILFLIK